MKINRCAQFVFIAFVVFLVGTPRAEAQQRTWTSVTGDRLVASFLRVSGQYVELQKSDGDTVKIAPWALSSADQEYIDVLQHPKTVSQMLLKDIWLLTVTAEARRKAGDEAGWREDLNGVDKWVNDNFAELSKFAQYTGSNPLNQLIAKRALDLVCRAHWKVQGCEVSPVDNTDKNRSVYTGVVPEVDVGVNQLLGGGASEEQAVLAREQEAFRSRQAEQARLRYQQAEIDRENQIITERAMRLEAQLQQSRSSNNVDYRGMAMEAGRLSQDSDRIGKTDSATQYGNAARSLQNIEREQNRTQMSLETLGRSRTEDERRAAEQRLFMGRSTTR